MADGFRLRFVEREGWQVLTGNGPNELIVCTAPNSEMVDLVLNALKCYRGSGKSIVQPWVETLGLRHQGLLMTAVRGCDVIPREDAAKTLTRVYRSTILVAHCGDPRNARSFILFMDKGELLAVMKEIVRSHDHLPMHFLFHQIHCAEVVGYKHPDPEVREPWAWFYQRMCQKLHLNPESEAQLDERLNADEATFAARQ